MKHRTLLSRRLAACASWTLVAACGAALGAGELQENPVAETPPARLLDELEANAWAAPPFTAEYLLTGPEGDRTAQLSMGEGYSFLLKVTGGSQGEPGETIMYGSKDGRVFVRSEGRSVFITDFPALADACAALRASLHGAGAGRLPIRLNFRMQGRGLHLSAGAPADWIDALRKDPAMSIKPYDWAKNPSGNDKPPCWEISGGDLGSVVVDAKTAVIREQQLDQRTLKLISYRKTAGVDKVGVGLEVFKDGDLETMSARDAMPDLRSLPFAICQRAVRDVEAGKLSVRQMTENMTAGRDRFMPTMDKAFLEGRKNFWDDGKMDDIAGKAFDVATKELAKKGLAKEAIEAFFQEMKPGDMAAPIAVQVKALIAEQGRPAVRKLAGQVISGDLKSATPEGAAAVAAIEDFLADSAIRNAALRACERARERLLPHKDQEQIEDGDAQ